jgi:G3E family GTPase
MCDVIYVICNGCFRDNGVKAIENLMTKRGKFDYILLETTGLADPGLLLIPFCLFV